MKRTGQCGVASFGLLWAAIGCSSQDGADRPTAARAEAILDAMDAAFNRAAADEFHGWFAPMQKLGASFTRVSQLLGHQGEMKLSSELVEFFEFGDFGIAQTRTTLSQGNASSPDYRSEHHSYLAFRATDDGPEILLYEDIDPAARAHLEMRRAGVYKCPPCNFSIGADTLSKWLVIPSPRRVSGCVESVSFRLLGEDIHLNLSIHRNDLGLGAEQLLDKLITDSQRSDVVERGAVQPWTPPHYASVPEGLTGAECVLVLEGDQRDHLHLVTRSAATGGSQQELCYLLTVRGDEQAHAAHDMDIMTWLKSFKLLDPAAPPHDAAEQSALAHSGGSMGEDGVYRNERYKLSFHGPGHWRVSFQADRCLLGVTYACPADLGVVHVAAHENMPGSLEQRLTAIYELVASQLSAEQYRIVEDTKWQENYQGDGPLFRRSLESHALDARADEQRLNQIFVFEDLWLLVDGQVRHESAVEAYAALVASVRH